MSNEFEGAIYGMGNPLLDICATVDDAFLAKYDLKANDQILADEKHDDLFPELLNIPGNYYIAGGATQNALRGAQRLLPPNSIFFTGSVSNDEFGAKLTQAAQADGLTVDYYIDETAPTGTCGTCITGHNRSLIAKLSAANNFKDSHLDKPEIWSRVEKARLYYIAGFFLTVSPPSIQRVAKHAAENNKIFCMNLSAPFLPQFFKGPMGDASPYWDVIFGNETEAIAYAENHDFGTKDVKEIALKIAALPKVNQSRPRLVVFTQGTEPTIVIENGNATEYPITPVANEEICDTNGAGDAFVGGFLSEYVRGSSIDRCVAAGHWLAGVVIRQAGPFYPPGELKFE